MCGVQGFVVSLCVSLSVFGRVCMFVISVQDLEIHAHVSCFQFYVKAITDSFSCHVTDDESDSSLDSSSVALHGMCMNSLILWVIRFFGLSTRASTTVVSPETRCCLNFHALSLEGADDKGDVGTYSDLIDKLADISASDRSFEGGCRPQQLAPHPIAWRSVSFDVPFHASA